MIQGQAQIYTGNTEPARETYKYFAPGLQATTKLLSELTRDQPSLSHFLARARRRSARSPPAAMTSPR